MSDFYNSKKYDEAAASVTTTTQAVPSVTPPPLFPLSNGACLRYELFTHGSEGRTDYFSKTWDVPGARTPKPPMKVALRTARMGQSWSDPLSSIQIVCADFDHLPPRFKDWAAFRTYLTRKYSNGGTGAIVTSSRHGRAKMFFAVVVPAGAKLDNGIALSFLEAKLTQWLFKAADKTGLKDSYVTHDMISSLNSGLRHLVASSLSSFFFTSISCSTTAMSKGLGKEDIAAINTALLQDKEESKGKPYRYYKGPLASVKKLPILKTFMNKGRCQLKLVKFLLETRSLTDRGFEISQTKLGVLLSKTQSYAGRLLRAAIADGIILCVDENFHAGKKSKRYVATAELVEAILEIHGAFVAGKPKRTLPSGIPDGEWHKTLWLEAKYWVHRKPEFLDAVAKIAGADEGKRMKEAEEAVEGWIAFFKLSPEERAKKARRA